MHEEPGKPALSCPSGASCGGRELSSRRALGAGHSKDGSSSQAPHIPWGHCSSSERQLLASQILSTSWEWSLPKSTSWSEKTKTKQNNKKTLLLCLTFSRLLRKGSVFLSVYYELFRSLLHCCHEKIQADVNYSDSVWGLMHSGGVERKMQWGRMWKPDFTWAIASAHCISWQ